MKNENNGQNYNQNYGQYYDDNNQNLYNRPYEKGMDRDIRRNNSNWLIIITLSVSIMALVVCAVLIVFFANKKVSDEKVVREETVVKETDYQNSEESLPEADVEDTPTQTTTPVEKTMYVVVNDYLILRSGPGKEYAEKGRMYRGDAVYVIENVSDDFARVTYNGVGGYASRRYLSYTQPAPLYQWDYSEYEIESIVTQSLNWYVNAVNTGNTSGAEQYFSGKIRETEINNAKKMAKTVASERLIRVTCYSYKRLSPTRVSVIRDSDIEIVEFNGKSRVASETRVYVLENTGNGTHIVDIHK